MSKPPIYRPDKADPNWRPIQRYTTADLPCVYRHWLLDDGSLTRRLIGLGGGDFEVRRLYQGWQTPLTSERALLDMPPRQLALIREVALLVSGSVVVFARSVFPHSSLTGSLTHLRKLQNKPLGAILFNHPGMHRSPFELALIAGNSDYLPHSMHQASEAWGRRSRFVIEGKALLVSEVFLEKFTPWAQLLPVHRTQRGTVNTAMSAHRRKTDTNDQ